MTTVNIISGNTMVEVDVDDLKDGDFLYSKNKDTLVMVVDDQLGNFNLVDLTDYRLVATGDNFRDTFNYYNDRHGPFHHVSSVSITHKI